LLLLSKGFDNSGLLVHICCSFLIVSLYQNRSGINGTPPK
jgi:hypothetical protein